MAHDVLDLDDGVVDQDAHHQRQAQQRHRVEREAEQVVQRAEGGQHRQGQRGGRHQRGAPVAQEQEDHDHGQHGALDQQGHRAVEVFFHRIDEVEGLGHRHVGVFGAEFGQRRAHADGDLGFTSAFRAHDLEAHHRLAVEQGAAAPLGHRVADRGHLVQADATAIGQRDIQPRQLFGALDRGDGAHRLLDAADIGAAARGVLLHRAQLARDVGRGGVQGQQARGIELDAHLTRHPAHPRYRANAAHGEDGLADVVVDEPGQRHFVHPARSHGVGQDGRAGQLDLGHHGVAQVTGQIGAHALHCGAHVVQRLLSRLLEAEFDGDDGRAVQHLGVDVLHPLQRSDGVFQLACDFGLELGRRRAGQGRADGDGGQVDVRKLLHLHRLEAHHAEHGEHHEQHHRGDRIADAPG